MQFKFIELEKEIQVSKTGFKLQDDDGNPFLAFNYNAAGLPVVKILKGEQIGKQFIADPETFFKSLAEEFGFEEFI